MEILAGRHQLGTGASCIALSLVGISYPILTQHPRPPCVTTASVVSTQCATGTTAGAVTLTGHRRICAHTAPPSPTAGAAATRFAIPAPSGKLPSRMASWRGCARSASTFCRWLPPCVSRRRSAAAGAKKPQARATRLEFPQGGPRKGQTSLEGGSGRRTRRGGG
jgi:hypothetical protein